MNNRFGDSRQRFSIRKFTVGVASVLPPKQIKLKSLKANQRRVYLRKPVSLMVGAKGRALVPQVKK